MKPPASLQGSPKGLAPSSLFKLQAGKRKPLAFCFAMEPTTPISPKLWKLNSLPFLAMTLSVALATLSSRSTPAQGIASLNHLRGLIHPETPHRRSMWVCGTIRLPRMIRLGIRVHKRRENGERFRSPAASDLPFFCRSPEPSIII